MPGRLRQAAVRPGEPPLRSAQTPEAFDRLVDDLRAGRLAAEVPGHGTLVRVRRSVGLEAGRERVAAERSAARAARPAGSGATS